MYEEIMQQAHGLGGVRQLFEPVGGGPYPFVQTRDVGPVRFGDVVVNSDEDVIVANSDASFDQVQDAYADDMLTSGDEGIGFAQARRLKSKLRRNRRRITESGYSVEAGAPYQFGDLGLFGIKINFKNPFGKKSIFGQAKKIVKKIKPLKVAAFIGSGLLGQKALSAGFNLVKGAITKKPQAVAVATESPADVPVPAPTGGADAVGTPIPADIHKAMSTASVSPVPAAASTASEDVAAQVQDAETANTMEAGMTGAGFTMPNFSDPKVLLTLAGLGIFAFLSLSKGGRGRSRSRSRRRR